MTEVLYDPINNEFYLFTGTFELDKQNKTMILYLQTRRRNIKIVEANQLFHIGWL